MIPPAGRRGVALAVVLWALVALAAVSLAAAVRARVDLAAATAYRDHAAALGLAEAGVADALAALAADPARALAADSLSGTLETGRYGARWAPVPGGGVVVTARGRAGRADRAVEARVWLDAGGTPRIAAWRERL